MTDDQLQKLVDVSNAQGYQLGTAVYWLQVIALLFCVAIFFIVLRRR